MIGEAEEIAGEGRVIKLGPEEGHKSLGSVRDPCARHVLLFVVVETYCGSMQVPIDGGATGEFISKACANRISGSVLEDKMMYLELVDGSPLAITQRIQLELRMGEWKFIRQLWIAPEHFLIFAKTQLSNINPQINSKNNRVVITMVGYPPMEVQGGYILKEDDTLPGDLGMMSNK